MSGYDITPLLMYRTNHVLQSGSMVSKIKALRPDSTILHIGHLDLWQGKGPDEILNDVKQIIYKVLETTDTKLCVSLVISHKHLNERIKLYNHDLVNFIKTVRVERRYNDRLFTTNNRKLTDDDVRSV